MSNAGYLFIYFFLTKNWQKNRLLQAKTKICVLCFGFHNCCLFQCLCDSCLSLRCLGGETVTGSAASLWVFKATTNRIYGPLILIIGHYFICLVCSNGGGTTSNAQMEVKLLHYAQKWPVNAVYGRVAFCNQLFSSKMVKRLRCNILCLILLTF